MSNCSIPDCYLDGPHEHTVSTGRIFNHPELDRMLLDILRNYEVETIIRHMAELIAIGGYIRDCLVNDIEEQIKRAVEEVLAQRDLEQFGESFVLNGNRISPNKFYKSTADYVKEAKEEGFRAGELAMRQRAFQCASTSGYHILANEIIELASSNPKGEK